MQNRRTFIKATGLAGASLVLPWTGATRRASAAVAMMGDLDPSSIPKYVTPLIIPPAMPRLGKARGRDGTMLDHYVIAVRQFQQQILPTGFNPTTVWSYGAAFHQNTFNYPAFTIEAEHDRSVP